MSSRIKISVFTTEIHDHTSQELISGILASSEMMGIDVVIASVGGIKQVQDFCVEKRALYVDVLDEYDFSGVIVLAGSMTNYVTIDELKDFLSFIPKTIPTITISVKVPGFPAILSDNFSPVKDIVSHLIKVHSKKKIMFIKGPMGQLEAESRFKGYLEALETNNIPMDKEYVFDGDFTPHSGANAIKELFNKKLELPDAIVCADDDTALGVYAEIKKRKINFNKENIAVTGFDNARYTKSMDPSLTTVDQQFYNQGRIAVAKLLEKIKGGVLGDYNSIPKIIYRNSCGCITAIDDFIEDGENFVEFVSSRLDDVKIEGLERDINSIANILNEFVENKEFVFSTKIDEFIAKYKYRGYNLNTLTEIINILSERVIEQLNRSHLLMFYKNMQRIQSNIIKAINNEKLRQFRNLNEQSSELDSILMALATVMSYQELEAVLDRNFYYLGIKSITLIFNNCENGFINGLKGRTFVKDDSLNRNSKVYCKLFLPLNSLNYSGYCELEILLNSFHIGEVLSFQISRALYLIEVFNNLKDKVREIEKSYMDLRVTKDLLIENEKLANLGGLVAGFTHEISTPLGVGVTGVSHLSGELIKIKEQFNQGELKKSEMGTFISTSEETADIILKNLERASSLVNGFKQISVDQASDIKREINLGSYLKEVTLSLSPITRSGKHRINLLVKDEIIIKSYPGVISQVVTNLVQNSIKHGFEDMVNGIIDILLFLDKKTIVLEYRDNGVGIPHENRDRIFEPYFSTKIGKGGSGLGMSIIKKLIEKKLLGSIKYSPNSPKGVCFIVTIPF